MNIRPKLPGPQFVEIVGDAFCTFDGAGFVPKGTAIRDTNPLRHLRRRRIALCATLGKSTPRGRNNHRDIPGTDQDEEADGLCRQQAYSVCGDRRRRRNGAEQSDAQKHGVRGTEISLSGRTA